MHVHAVPGWTISAYMLWSVWCFFYKGATGAADTSAARIDVRLRCLACCGCCGQQCCSSNPCPCCTDGCLVPPSCGMLAVTCSVATLWSQACGVGFDSGTAVLQRLAFVTWCMAHWYAALGPLCAGGLWCVCVLCWSLAGLDVVWLQAVQPGPSAGHHGCLVLACTRSCRASRLVVVSCHVVGTRLA